jgi:carboxyl-terminal processing protease
LQSIDATGVAEFRRFAAAQGITIPETAEADSTLQRVLLVAAARARFGDAGYYRVSAALDPEVQTARKAFDDARFATLVKGLP